MSEIKIGDFLIHQGEGVIKRKRGTGGFWSLDRKFIFDTTDSRSHIKLFIFSTNHILMSLV